MPSISPLWFGTTNLVLQAESGDIELADRSTRTDIYSGPYSTCVAGLLSRGTFGTGTRDGWVVARSKASHSKGGIGRLEITWEAAGSNSGCSLPSDDFDLQPVELYPRVERNSYFASLTTATLALAYSTVQSATPEARSRAKATLDGLSNSTQKTLGLALADKLQKGVETFYMAGVRYTAYSHSWTVPTLTIGGSIQAPAGPLSGKFGTMSGLRLADGLQPVGVNGSMFKLSRIWLLGPAGHWDSDLYP